VGNDSGAATKYRILTLDDFTKVPEEHIDECLRAFKAEIAFARRLKTAAGNAIERELRDLEARERDEKMGGFEPAYLKRFLFYAPKSKDAAG
jgi:hypothetical protein